MWRLKVSAWRLGANQQHPRAKWFRNNATCVGCGPHWGETQPGFFVFGPQKAHQHLPRPTTPHVHAISCNPNRPYAPAGAEVNGQQVCTAPRHALTHVPVVWCWLAVGGQLGRPIQRCRPQSKTAVQVQVDGVDWRGGGGGEPSGGRRARPHRSQGRLLAVTGDRAGDHETVTR